MPENPDLSLRLLELVSPYLLLLLSWFIGSRILHKWEIRKKRAESDISITSEFYKLYGEFSSVWRLWKVFYENNKKDKETGMAKVDYWELLKRAANVEGGMEAVFVKLASEKCLDAVEIKSLGLFRQAIQQLRQSIRDFDEMDWQRRDKEYILLKKLSIITAKLINQPNENIEDKVAVRQLADITAINSDTWKNEIADFGSFFHEKE